MDGRMLQEAIDRTQSVLEVYDNNTQKKIILTENEYLEEYPYRFTKLNGLFNPLQLGFTDRYFGGNIDKCAQVAGKPYILLVDKNEQTLGVYIPNDRLKDLTVPELKKLCTKFNREYKAENKKDELIALLLA